MKLKHIILVLLAFPVIAFSCIEDLGNYDYLPQDDVMAIKISGFNDTVVQVGDLLEIEPIVENLDSNVEYTYTWYMVREFTGGFAPERDTLSYEKKLSAVIKILPDIVYNLYFTVTDKERDIYAMKQVKLKATLTPINEGWYVLKELDGKTDFDYIKSDTTLFISNVLRDIMGEEEYVGGPATVGDQQLEGKPKFMLYQGEFYTYYPKLDAEGKTSISANNKVFHIVSENDFKTFNTATYLKIKSFGDQFYSPPAEKNIQGLKMMGSMMGGLHCIASGKKYAVSFMAAHITPTVFGSPIPSSNSPNYYLHDDFALASYGGALCFDTVSRSFFVTFDANASSTFQKFEEPTDDQIEEGFLSLSNMDYDLVFMRQRETSGGFAMIYSLMKSVVDGSYMLMYMQHSFYGFFGRVYYPPINYAPIIYFRDVPSSSGLIQADAVSPHLSADAIYYGKDNILSYYLDTPADINRDIEIKEFPSDEKISFIKNTSDRLYVLTNSPAGWKLYSFLFVGSSSPDIKANEGVEIGRGEGAANYMMIR